MLLPLKLLMPSFNASIIYRLAGIFTITVCKPQPCPQGNFETLHLRLNLGAFLVIYQPLMPVDTVKHKTSYLHAYIHAG